MAELRRSSEQLKKEHNVLKMMASEEVVLLRQQLLALRNALRLSETEAMQIKKELEKEVGNLIIFLSGGRVVACFLESWLKKFIELRVFAQIVIGVLPVYVCSPRIEISSEHIKSDTASLSKYSK